MTMKGLNVEKIFGRVSRSIGS